MDAEQLGTAQDRITEFKLDNHASYTTTAKTKFKSILNLEHL